MFALYVHYPYCTAICPYCDFNVRRARDALDEETLLKAYRAQLQFLRARTRARAFTSVFFGGGTPSLMRPRFVGEILQTADDIFGLAKDAEISLEANPAEATLAHLQELQAAGITRLSLGVQSLRDEGLRALGRLHNVADARAALGAVARVFPRYSLDLIYARPDQSADAWGEELSDALALGAPHYALYQLTLEPGTPLHRRWQQGKLTRATEDEAARLYEITQTQCEAAGLAAYEISNHACAPAHYCRHNLDIWRGAEYLGIGPGAAGRFIRKRARYASKALASPRAWVQQSAAGGMAQLTRLSERDARTEAMALGLRLAEGVARARVHPIAEPQVCALRKQGLLATSPTHLRATARGRLVLDTLCAQLLNGQ